MATNNYADQKATLGDVQKAIKELQEAEQKTKEPEKRIVITEVYGGCRNLRITDEGTYCAAYIHGGWEKIEPDACDHCQREKYLMGKSRQEVLDLITRTLEKKAEQMVRANLETDIYDNPGGREDIAQAVLDALLEVK